MVTIRKDTENRTQDTKAFTNMSTEIISTQKNKAKQEDKALPEKQNNKQQTSTRKGTVALFAILVLAAATGNLSQTALNTMLNTVVVDFGIGVDLGQWLTTIYMLSLGISVPLTGFCGKKLAAEHTRCLCFACF